MKLIGFAITLGGIASSWAGMIYGWGLQPQSWPWIIGTAAASMLLIGCGQVVSKDAE